MFLNRLKTFLLLLVLLFLSVLFWQNRELLSLKILCPDVNQVCFYQTPPLPLAIWMLAFTVAGVVTSLVWQFLSYLGVKSSRQRKSSATSRYVAEPDNRPRGSQPEIKQTNPQSSSQSRETFKRASGKTSTPENPASSPNIPERSDWDEDNRNDDWDTEESTPLRNKSKYQPSQDSSRKRSSDNTYSYKSRPESESQNQQERVYDANYRVINPLSRKIHGENRQEEDDDEWI